MKFRWLAFWCAATTILTVSSAAVAQNTRQAQTDQAPPATSQAPLYDPQQLPSQRGQVLQFTLTARGEIDGLILTDGTEVKTPAHLSTQIAHAVKRGDTVTVHGLRAAALPLVQAVSITDETTRLSVVDNDTLEPARDPGARRRPPPPLPPRANAMLGSTPAPPTLTELQGRVRMKLHGPQGEVNGALLQDGTILRLPPPAADRLATLLQPGQSLVAEGTVVATTIGKVFAAQQIGASRDQLSLVEAPRGRDPGRRAALPPGPPPAPVDGPGLPPPSQR